MPPGTKAEEELNCQILDGPLKKDEEHRESRNPVITEVTVSATTVCDMDLSRNVRERPLGFEAVSYGDYKSEAHTTGTFAANHFFDAASRRSMTLS